MSARFSFSAAAAPAATFRKGGCDSLGAKFKKRAADPVRSVRLIRCGLLLSIVVAACPSAEASASEVCDTLRSQLTSPAPQNPAPPRMLADPSREPLLGELADLEARAEALGCSRGSIVVIDGPNHAACRRIASLIDDIQMRLYEAETGDMAAAPADSPARTRAEVARRMRMNGCADAPPPIEGVSQFSDPGSAGISSLSPGEPSPFVRPTEAPSVVPFPEETAPNAAPSIMQVPEPPKGHVPDLSEALSGAEPGIDRLPPALHSKALPMTERQRHVRRVGPRFLPDREDGLKLGPKDE